MMAYFREGVYTLIHIIPLALIVLIIFYGIKTFIILIQKRKFIFDCLNILWTFLWIIIVLSILKVTGILYGDFTITSPFDNSLNINFDFLSEGFTPATILNIVLFLPFGFLSSLAFNGLNSHWYYGLLVGFLFSILIEFLQAFCGRYVQLDDVVMNTLGAFLGFLVLYVPKGLIRRAK